MSATASQVGMLLRSLKLPGFVRSYGEVAQQAEREGWSTNVSEGRGTDSPFLLLGAPWLDSSGVAVSVPGFHLEPARFLPRSSPAAPDPKYPDQECRGLRVRVSGPSSAEPYRLGVTLLAALARQPGFE